jgi:hypothetical protein|nr:MAG TPA: hypothetical protein [Caudoviricetes sp.]
MKQADIDWIKKICGEKHTKNIWAKRAQMMAKNIKPLHAACDGDDDIPFEALELLLKLMVKKYDIAVGSTLVITDIDGGMTYHACIVLAHKSPSVDKADWLFTVHGDTMYEMYIKLVLMTFVTVKEGRVGKRRKPNF